jgi:predicted transcriptional regulator
MNWKQITNEILEGGLTQVQLAKLLGVSQAWVHEMASGKRVGDPKWTHGQALLLIHRGRPSRVS